MKAVVYIRVSSKDQNPARQEKALKAYANREGITEIETIIDHESGAVPFRKRGAAKIFTDDAVKLLIIHDLDRLGRDTIDILKTIKALHERGICIQIHKLGMATLLEDGSENPAAKIIISVMGTLAEMERKKIKERQKEGIAIAKAQGKYKGRKKGAKNKDTRDYVKKYPKVARELRANSKRDNKLGYRRLAALCGVAVNTVRKVEATMG